MLHHQHGIDYLTGARHPTFMAGHGFCGTNVGTLIAKNCKYGLGFIGIAHRCGGGMGIYIIYFTGFNMRLVYSFFHSQCWAINVWCGDMIPIG